WEQQKAQEMKDGVPPWREFEMEEDWSFARFLMKSGMSQEKIDELLHLEVVKGRMQPPFQNKYEFFKKIDALPKGPGFRCETVTIVRDVLDTHGVRLKEVVELWLRDPVECVRDLMGKPTLRDVMSYLPTKVYTNAERRTRVYEEMWTGDWWWNVQEKLPRGATVAPVILALDKTQLSTFSGDKSAYPVYLTLGSIAKQVRRQPSRRATILLGYLPIPTLSCCSPVTQQLKGYEVFHACMARLLEPMITAGTHGVSVLCSNGRKRHVFPLLAAYCADHPEQCVVACSKENRCPKGSIGQDERGGLELCWGRDQDSTLAALQEVLNAKTTSERRSALESLHTDGIQVVFEPFWKHLPHCDIFSALMPDILHQLHKGVFHAHLVSWCDQSMSPGELDRRFISMAHHPHLRHFSKGITSIKQWTGKEQRAMESVFVSAISGGVNDNRVVIAARALLDFIYLAQLHCHTSDTLTQMTESLQEFHRAKSVFVENGVRAHFNIPKLHSLVHYVDSITACGAADGYNTEYPERFHIEYAKLGYRASNKREYKKQMVTWLERQEAVDLFDSYSRWAWDPAAVASHMIQDAANVEVSETSDEDLDTSLASPPDLFKHTKLRLAKVPPLSNISLSTIRHHFHIPDFISSLNSYLARLAASHPGVRVENVGLYDTFTIYKRAHLLVPSPALGVSPLEDRIRATPARVARVLPTLGSTAFFGTILVKTPPPIVCKLMMYFAGSQYCYRVARLRLIFELPTVIRELARSRHPLAYVQWFTDLKASRHPTRVFQVSKVLNNRGQPTGEVIPLGQIVRSCHLIPQWENDLTAPMDCPLDVFNKFLVNDFLDIHSYL
ncbi:hypothetical protein M407DRAFT_45836, partial [Tulasnella calospora MUT 4182]